MASEKVIIALDLLHKELEKLEPAIKHIETAQMVTQIVKEIPEKHIDLLKSLKEEGDNHKEELKKIFKAELSKLGDENKKLTETTTVIQKDVKSELEAVGKVNSTVKNFHDRVEKINFPDRLDKVDASVAGMMAAVQAIQSRLDLVERNISDKLKEMGHVQSFNSTQIKEEIVELKKKQFYQSMVTWVLIALSLIVLTIMNRG